MPAYTPSAAQMSKYQTGIDYKAKCVKGGMSGHYIRRKGPRDGAGPVSSIQVQGGWQCQ